jgi:hypothetical protein
MSPELLAPRGVVRRDFDVHDFTWHRCLLGSLVTAMPPSVLALRGRVNSPAAARMPGYPAIFVHVIG